jgi:hypothetical protein
VEHQGGRKVEPEGEKSEVNDSQEGKEQDPVGPLCAGWPVGKVLSFHDSSVNPVPSMPFSLAQHRKSPPIWDI